MAPEYVVLVRPAVHLDYEVEPLGHGTVRYRDLRCEYIEEAVLARGGGVAPGARLSEHSFELPGQFARLTIRRPSCLARGEYEFSVDMDLSSNEELARFAVVPYGCWATLEGLDGKRCGEDIWRYLRAHIEDRAEVDIVRALLGGELSADQARAAAPLLVQRARARWRVLQRSEQADDRAVARRPLLAAVGSALDALAAEPLATQVVELRPVRSRQRGQAALAPDPVPEHGSRVAVRGGW